MFGVQPLVCDHSQPRRRCRGPRETKSSECLLAFVVDDLLVASCLQDTDGEPSCGKVEKLLRCDFFSLSLSPSGRLSDSTESFEENRSKEDRCGVDSIVVYFACVDREETSA